MLTINNSAGKSARLRAGLEQVRVHDLKYTFGRRFRAANVSFTDRQDLPGHKEMMATGAWWDYVDSIAIGLVGRILTSHPGKLKPLLRRWARDDDTWRRRTAMLAQLKFNADTDEALLFRAIDASIDESEFFLRRGIGWALREYSKRRPDAVVALVEKHKDRLSGLSEREFWKVLLKRGVV